MRLLGYALLAVACLGLSRRQMLREDRSTWAVLVPICLATLALVIRSTLAEWHGDYLSAYYPAGRLIATRPQEVYGPTCALGFVNVPVVADLFRPLAVLPSELSARVFVGLGLLGIAASVLALRSLLGTAAVPWLIALTAISGPLWYSVREGNTTHLLFPLLVGSLLAQRAQRPVLAGALIGVVAVIKLPFALFGAYFLGRRMWRALAGFAAVAVATAALSITVHGLSLHQQWIDNCVAPFAGRPLAAFNVQSLSGFLARAYGFRPDLWTPVEPPVSLLAIQRVLSLLLTGGVAWVLYRAGRPDSDRQLAVEFSLVTVLLLIISPLSWTHYYLFMLLPLALLGAEILRPATTHAWRLVLVGSIVVICSLPLRPLVTGIPQLYWFETRVLMSLHLFGGIALLGYLLLMRRSAPE